MLIELRCPPSENLLLSVSVRGCQRSLGLASTLHVWQPLLARTVCKEKAQNQDEEDLKTHESERKLCIWVKLPRGSGGGGGSSSSTESTWEASFFYFIWQEGENNLTSRLSLSSSPLPVRFTLLFFLLACFTIRGVFTSPFTSFGKIP